MVALELNQVEVDHCVACGGVWLDAGELELLLEGAQRRDEVLASLVADPTIPEAVRRCPICDRKMEKVRTGDDRDIIIDRCRRNDGVWLDRGELHQVVRMGGGSDENPVQKLLVDMFGGDA
jgi:Zn-finger nucleic acid-binding protein